MADLIGHLGHIIPMGYADVQADHVTPVYRKGQFGLVIDDFGVRIFRYLHNKAASAANAVAGGLYSRAANVAIASIDTGSTTTLIKKAAGFTADAQIGWMAYYLTNNTTPGAAPEGETAIVTANTAGAATLDSGRPLSATPNAADAVTFLSLWDFIKSATGDLASNVFGVCVATAGITNGNWGLLQQYGLCPDVKCLSSAAQVAGKACIAQTEQVTVSSSSAVNLLVGIVMATIAGTNRGKSLIFLDLFSPSPVSA